MLSRLCEWARFHLTMSVVHQVCNKSALDCLETVAGVIQVGTQWFLFSIMYVISIPRDYLQADWPYQPCSLHTLLPASS